MNQQLPVSKTPSTATLSMAAANSGNKSFCMPLLLQIRTMMLSTSAPPVLLGANGAGIQVEADPHGQDHEDRHPRCRSVGPRRPDVVGTASRCPQPPIRKERASGLGSH